MVHPLEGVVRTYCEYCAAAPLWGARLAVLEVGLKPRMGGADVQSSEVLGCAVAILCGELAIGTAHDYTLGLRGP